MFAAYRIGSRALKNAALLAVAALAFLAIFALNMLFPYIVLTAGIQGYLGGRYAPDKFATDRRHGGVDKSFGPANIDDHTPTPEHARLNGRRLVYQGTAGLALWGGVMALLALFYGGRGTLTQMGWFFTKAALLTFGGAYAVLPYVYQGGIEHYHWLTPAQMIDCLALGETTPGPLIMVVAFVGFVGGWTREFFGPDRLFAAGAAAATVVTYFTFLPSFLFILLGGPFIETTSGDIKFTALLTGITAAVVGVVLNLAVFFGYHVLWPRGFGGMFEWPLLVIGLAASAALFRYKIGIIPVIAACEAAGLVYTLIRPLLGIQLFFRCSASSVRNSFSRASTAESW